MSDLFLVLIADLIFSLVQIYAQQLETHRLSKPNLVGNKTRAPLSTHSSFAKNRFMAEVLSTRAYELTECLWRVLRCRADSRTTLEPFESAINVRGARPNSSSA